MPSDTLTAPSTARTLTDPQARERLSAFARWLRAERLDALNDAQTRLHVQLDIPLLRLFTHLGEDQLKEMGKAGLVKFLTDLEAGLALDVAAESLRQWEADELPGIPKESIEASDLVLVYVAQERAMLAFLPEFAKDVADALAIAGELRTFYAAAQDEAFKLFTRMRAEAAEREIAQSEELAAQSEELAAQGEELASQQAELLETNDVLAKQRLLLDSVLNHVPGALGYCDRDLVIRVVNDRYAAQLGKPAAELLDRPVAEAVPDLPEETLQALREVLRTGEPLVGYSVPTPMPGLAPGEERFQDYAIVPVFDERGVATGLLSLSTDVTDRLRLERELERHSRENERNKSLLERIVSQAPVGLAYLDAGLVVRRMNPAFVDMFDRPADDFLDRHLLDFVPPESKERLEALLATVLRTGETQHLPGVEVQASRGGVGTSYVDFSYAPSFDEAGRPDGILVFAREVSERVERERNQALQIDQLRELDRMKDEFLGALSYQLGTPINTVLGFATVLEEGAVGGDLRPEQRTYLRRIIATSQVQLALVNDLLDLSRFSGGKFELARTAVDVVAIAQRVLDALGPLVEQQGQRPITYLPAGLPTVMADEQRLEQVLTGLVHGAHRLTPPGGLLRVQVAAEPGALRVEVQDSGPTLAEETAERIFERYTQVGGTWLGLAIARRIVEAHGGTIGVEAKPGEGNRFWLRLPLSV
jgi:PAS domain S-box-containing protein